MIRRQVALWTCVRASAASLHPSRHHERWLTQVALPVGLELILPDAVVCPTVPETGFQGMGVEP